MATPTPTPPTPPSTFISFDKMYPAARSVVWRPGGISSSSVRMIKCNHSSYFNCALGLCGYCPRKACGALSGGVILVWNDVRTRQDLIDQQCLFQVDHPTCQSAPATQASYYCSLSECKLVCEVDNIKFM